MRTPLFSAVDVDARARELIAAAHDADPARASDGRAAEEIYAAGMERWLQKLVPEAPPLLRLAARCQHLERWKVPRSTFPLDRPGYLDWRRSLYARQANRAGELLAAAGVPDPEIAEAKIWISKTGLKTNPGTQALEDAACLVFLETEIEKFAAEHASYPREKFLGILQKTWRKMSPPAQELARGLPHSTAIAGLVQSALARADKKF